MRMSARLNFESALNIICMPLAALSLARWKQIELCFFFSLDSAMDAFLNTASLLQKTLARLSIGIPNIRSLCHKDTICSVAILRATNSDPNVEDSTVFWRLENHDTGALLTYMIIPVCDLRVILSPA